MSIVRLFDCGMLKTGLCGHHRIAECNGRSLGEAWMQGEDHALITLGSNCQVVPISEEQRSELTKLGVASVVHGELFELDESKLHDVEFIDGHPNYERVMVRVTRAGGYPDHTEPAILYRRKFALSARDTICCEGVWWPRTKSILYGTGKRTVNNLQHI